MARLFVFLAPFLSAAGKLHPGDRTPRCTTMDLRDGHLSAYLQSLQKNKGSWEEYERMFIELVTSRKIEESLSDEIHDGDCLLCSEDKPNHCHRRLVAEYLKAKWRGVQIEHIF